MVIQFQGFEFPTDGPAVWVILIGLEFIAQILAARVNAEQSHINAITQKLTHSFYTLNDCMGSINGLKAVLVQLTAKHRRAAIYIGDIWGGVGGSQRTRDADFVCFPCRHVFVKTIQPSPIIVLT